MTKGLLQDDVFYCNHLGASERDEKDIIDFSVSVREGTGLIHYLRQSAYLEEKAGIMRTYLVRDNKTDELAGYFSLKAGLVSANEVFEQGKVDFDTYPGIEVANFAVNNRYITTHPYAKGCGLVFFRRFIRPIIQNVSKEVGISMIYIFAIPVENLIRRYCTYGFQRLSEEAEILIHKRLKPSYDEGCIFMYQML